MSAAVTQRAPAVAGRLEAARAHFAELQADVAAHLLEEIEGRSDAAALRRKAEAELERARQEVVALTTTAELAQRLDRAAERDARKQMREEHLAAFKRHFAERGEAMTAMLAAIASLVEAGQAYAHATAAAISAMPVGTAMPPLNFGSNGVFGPVLGMPEKLLAGEIWRLSKRDQNGHVRVPFGASPSIEFVDQPHRIPPAAEQFREADAVIIASIEQQLDRLALDDEQRDQS